MPRTTVTGTRGGRRSPAGTVGRRGIAAIAALLLPLGVVPALLAASPAAAAVGAGFNLNASDLRFILKQIKIAEQHATTATAAKPCGTLLGSGPDQIPNANGQGVELPWGLRTVDGTCNNLRAGQERYGSADRPFPRMTTAQFRAAEPSPFNGAPSSYAQTSGTVFDSSARVASNLIVDQTPANPAAVAAAGEGATPDPDSGSLYIPNVAPDEGLSAPYNSLFTLFGQFFDHGLDLVTKGGGTVYVPLKNDDPLVLGKDGVLGTDDDLDRNYRFMVLTRATVDGNRNATNKTSPYVDQSQTYTSHPSHQVFLRQYELNAAGDPVSTGHLLNGPDGGLATWATAKKQARDLLGIALTDQDVFNVPMLATDPYGRFIPGPNGHPQLVTGGGGLVEGDPAAGGGAGVAVPADAVRTGHAFLDDIAHHAVPFGDNDIDPRNAPGPRVPDGDPGTSDDGQNATYDDEMLDAHYLAGDGRINENIGLTAIHHVFHAEHNRLTDDIKAVLQAEDPTQVPQWQLDSGVWNGERLFQAARFVTEMQYQHLAFEEFARKVQPQINVFDKSYDTSIDPAIPAEFAHAVYRFGHSMLNETVARRTPTGTRRDMDLLKAFLNPPAFTEGGLTPEQATGDIVRGMADQVGNEIDEFVTEALRNRLLGLPLDLGTLNIARARETGTAPLNAVRRQFSAQTNGNSALAPYANWIDFGLGLRHHESLVNFVAAYGRHPSVTGATTLAGKRQAATLLVSNQPLVDRAGNVHNPPDDAVDFMNGTGAWADAGDRTTTGLDDVDLWVGGLAEKPAPFGGLLGSTFNHVFEKSMEDLQDGDRFYYLSRTNGLNLLVQLEGNSFAEMISRNTDADKLPADAFSRPDLTFDLEVQNATGAIVEDPATSYSEPALLTRMADGTIRYAGKLHALFIGAPRDNRVRSGEGDDTLRGHDGRDRLEGGAGNDQFVGGLGEDVLTDSFGDDVLKGGDGHDALASGPGLDLNQGGRGDDFVVGGSDPTETFGGPGDDIVYGGESHDTVFGDDGDDWLEGGNQADLVQGDNGALFQDDLNTPGHDVLIGGGGPDDYDAEGGDDVLVAGAGIERNEGMLGFDFVTHKGETVPADADLALSGLLPPALDVLRDRFDGVEAASGWNLDDTLRGDDRDGVAAEGAEGTMVGHELTAAGIARVSGLAALLPAGATSFSSGNLLIGGAGSDVLEGRGGNDVLDGDAWLDVQLRVTDPSGGVRLVDSLGQLQADVMAGRIDGGDITIARTVVVAPAGTSVDTAVFSGPRADYDIRQNADGTTTVAHVRGTAADGTDTLRNVEKMRFSDGGGETAPDMPTNVVARAGDSSATVTWTPPASDGGSPILEYEIEVQNLGIPVFTVGDIPATATSWNVTGLDNGNPYTFIVTAVNAVGSTGSVVSNEVTPTSSITVPGAPVIGTAAAGPGSATVRWTPPTSDGGSPITSYSVQVRTGTTIARTVTGVPANATSTVVSGLTAGTPYNFRVRAVNAVGNGVLSAASNVVTPTAGATVPAAPTSVAATAGNASATVRWTPGSDGGSAVTSWQVQVRTGTTVVRTVTGIAAGSTSTAVSGLTNGTAYNFRVRAVNAVGLGTLSTPTAAVTPTAGTTATVPGAPVIGTAVAGTTGGAITATANWSPPASTGGSAITGYVVRALRMNANGTVAATTTSAVQQATARSLVMTLPMAGNYRFTVQARNAVGSGVQSARSNQVAGR